MRYRYKVLSGIPVETQSGETLGRLVDAVVDTDGHMVVQYVVSKSKLLSKLLPSELLVNSQQVVSVDKKKMVVRDSAVEEMVSASAVAAAERAAGATQGVTGRIMD